MGAAKHIPEQLDTAWWTAFANALRTSPHRDALRVATMSEDLKAWTTLLTGVVAESFRSLGWSAAAKGHAGGSLPVSRQEYLGIDAIGFLPSEELWPAPIVAVELENKQTQRDVAYSLWKVLCVRASLRVVFAYRRDWEDGRSLTEGLSDAFFRSVSPERRLAVDGPVLVILGCRGEGDAFPSGYFKVWRLQQNTGRFERIE